MMSVVFFFKQKTAYEMRISDWSSDVCSSDLIKFVSTSVKPTSATEADIAGNLTIHGVTRPVTIKAEFTGQGGNPMTKAATVGFVGRTQIQRSEFGVGKFVPMVGDEVTLKITAAFEQKAAE